MIGGVEKLSEALAGWRPGTVTMTRRVDPWSVAAFADLIGTAAPGLNPGDPLPPMWHWFTLLEHPATREIGADGHPAHGPFLPPIPGRRRMFAGGRLRLTAPIPVGADLTGESGVTGVTVKTGRTGELAFVTVRTELSVDGAPAGAEEQDIVYRSEPEGTPPRRLERQETGEPEPDGDWRLYLDSDPVLLSRFSGLTYNGHRIHFDQPYVTATEGYPDLVIHGPLLALLALELPRLHAPGRTVRAFEYRLVRPAFVPARIVSAGWPDDGGADDGGADGVGVTLTVAAVGAAPSLTAKAVLA
jgi:3-methylfumaryl-CoA hydratase